MPTYNRAGYILETIDCIIAQTYAHWELLIIDDGSTDNTASLVKSINDSRIQYYRFERVGITGKLKNYGIGKSKGALIAFMDSDDIWPVQKLEKQVNAMLEHPQAGFSFTNGFNFTEPYNPEVYFYSNKQGVAELNVFTDFCTTNIGIRTPTLLFWKDCIEKTGLFKETRVFADYSFIGELCYHFKAVILYEPLFYRRLHSGNNFNSNSYEDYQEYFETIDAYIREHKIEQKTVSYSLFKSHIHAGDLMVILNNKKSARNHYIYAWKCNIYSFIPLKRYIKMYLRHNT